MTPVVVVRVLARSGLAGNAAGTLAICWRASPDHRLAHFVFENGQLAPLGWSDFYRLTRLVGFDDVAAEAFSTLDLPTLAPAGVTSISGRSSAGRGDPPIRRDFRMSPCLNL